MQFGEKIRKMREREGFKQEYIADKLGISITAYSKIENGETKLTIDRLEAIAHIFNTDWQTIANFDPNTNFNIHNSPKSAIGNNPTVNENEKMVDHLLKEISFLREQLTKVFEMFLKNGKPE